MTTSTIVGREDVEAAAKKELGPLGFEGVVSVEIDPSDAQVGISVTALARGHATHAWRNDGGLVAFFWGHYDMSPEDAQDDLRSRCERGYY